MSQGNDKVARPQTFTGTVVSNKMQSTVVVELKSQKRHPKYHKSYTVKKRLYAHDETGAQMGDKVTIVATRPISKLKKFKVIERK